MTAMDFSGDEEGESVRSTRGPEEESGRLALAAAMGVRMGLTVVVYVG